MEASERTKSAKIFAEKRKGKGYEKGEYRFDWHTMKESECVAELMKMYQSLVEQQ